MEKSKILEDIQSLIQDIDECTTSIIEGRATGDAIRVNDALYMMESLIVKSFEELNFLYDYIKEGGNNG